MEQEIGMRRIEAGTVARDFARRPLRIGILLWPTFPMMSLAGLVESLRHAGDHGDSSKGRYTRWDILGERKGKILSSCGIAVETTATYPAPAALDYLFVIGGLLRAFGDAPPQHRHYILACHEVGLPIVGVCTGIFALADAGLLDNRPVCVHPFHERDFNARFPNHRIVKNKDFVTSGAITTVLGGISMLPLMSGIIGAHFGPDRSAKTVHQMTLPAPDGIGALERATFTQHAQIPDARIQKALVLLDAQATQNPSIAALARSLGLSERHFLRLFRKQVGTSPKDYLVEMKLGAAVWMLQHTARSITQIAYLTGFSSGANLADHCQKRLHASPTKIRAAARGVA